MERIKINDGSKSYEIVNQNDKVLGTFTFNPSDMNIVEKYNDVVKNLKMAIEKMGEGNDAALIEASSLLRDKMDVLFGEDTSKTFFSITGPLTPLANGQLFIESVLEGIGAVIETEMKVRVEKVRGRMDKYTEKYNK